METAESLNFLGLGACTCRFAWKRMKDAVDCPLHRCATTRETAEMGDDVVFSNGSDEKVIMKLCPATYDEPQRADRSDTHTCSLEEDHDGPHYCELCKSWWLARVGVVPGQQKDREQIALARMDAHLLGTGWVMVTPGEDGGYAYERVDPVRVTLESASADEVDVDVEEAVRRTAARALAAHRIGEKLQLLIRRAEMRQDKMRGWVGTGPLKELLNGGEAETPKTLKTPRKKP